MITSEAAELRRVSGRREHGDIAVSFPFVLGSFKPNTHGQTSTVTIPTPSKRRRGL